MNEAREWQWYKGAPPWRGFTTTILPEPMHRFISESLQRCKGPSDVAGVFGQAHSEYVLDGKMPTIEPLEEHAYPHDKIVLQQHIHEVFNNVAERGHKALSEESEQ